ncbi:hypothetical protein D3C83_102090 [compost metagenome]
MIVKEPAFTCDTDSNWGRTPAAASKRASGSTVIAAFDTPVDALCPAVRTPAPNVKLSPMSFPRLIVSPAATLPL